MIRISTLAAPIVLALGAWLAAAGAARADGTIGTSFPADFPVINDASLGTPLIGFGAAGPVRRTPVIFVHGNNDTPFPTACNPFFGRIQAFAQFFADQGYAAGELWGLGYQGDQCDLLADQTHRSAEAHTAAANVADLRRFVHAVLEYTGAREVDLVGHSLGVIVAREWLRQDRRAHHKVRHLVAIDGPNHGIINCSPSPLNYWQAPALGGFTPASAICQELGSPNTPFLKRLNRAQHLHGEHGHDRREHDNADEHASRDGHTGRETPRSVRTFVIRNADTGFVYFPTPDGVLAGVPAIDSFGEATDFSTSASLKGARELNLTGQGTHDPILGTTHLGILNSPDTRKATLDFLQRRAHRH